MLERTKQEFTIAREIEATPSQTLFKVRQMQGRRPFRRGALERFIV